MVANATQVREQMVSHQLRTWEVLDDRILDVVRALPRERFVPEAWQGAAYGDLEIPLAHGQHMLAPKVVGRILQALAVRPGEKVLELGTGSGYLTACLALLGGQVTSYEIHADLADAARAHLAATSIPGGVPRVVTGDAFEAAAVISDRFDAIAVTGSLPVYDARFEALLQPGGRMFVVVGEGPAMEARLVTRSTGSSRNWQSLFETRLDPLLNAPRTEPFRF